MEQPNWNKKRASNWHLFGPPARPSAGEVAHYENQILKHPKNASVPWVLLGSTVNAQ